MKFLELNKKRHAVKSFSDRPLDIKDVRTAIEIATLAPSAHNIQPWKFVLVEEKKEALASLAFGGNYDQVQSAPLSIVLFADTDLKLRARKIARIGGKSLPEEDLQYFLQNLPAEFDRFSAEDLNSYLSLNTGLVALNLVLALTDQGIASNMILGFDKEKVNEALDIDKRFRPELMITVGYSQDKPEPSYRLPVDELIERR